MTCDLCFRPVISFISDLASMEKGVEVIQGVGGGGGVRLELLVTSSIPPLYILHVNNFVHITQYATGHAN